MIWKSLILSLILCPINAYAFDPISAIGIVASPIFCKIIQCKTETINYMYSENREASQLRLKEMREKFDWEDMHEEGECAEYTDEEKNGKACMVSGKWKIVDNF